MDNSQATEQTRRRLELLLAGDRPQAERLLTRLRELRQLERAPVCSLVLHMLAHLSMDEEQAEGLLVELLEHREKVTAELGRDPGLRVAAIDYLSNVRKLLRNPTIVELAQLQNTERCAATDSLTGLYNRRYFDEAIEVEIRRSARYSLDAALLMLDLDAFKPVNDLYGHPFGDLVLKSAGTIIRRAVRESDLACRFGGEEFTVILPETTRLGAFAVAERVRRAVEREFAHKPLDGRAVAMTISGGVACYPHDGRDPHTLVERADRSLYLSKTAGRNRVSIYHSEQRRAVRYPVRGTARTRIARTEGVARNASTLNLSRDGALLATSGSYRTADEVQLIFGRRGHDRVVGARVVRVEQTETEPAGHLVAVAFESPLPEPFVLQQAGRNLPPRVAQRGLA